MNRVVLCLLALAVISCGGSGPEPRPDAPRPGTTADTPSPEPSPTPGPTRSSGPRVVALGDSLTAGLGIAPDEAYPAVLQRKLTADGYAVEVVNAGVSGDTSADGLRRVGWALDGDVRLLILALGANDGLRGLPVGQMQENLQGILDRAAQRGIPVLLVGMQAPPNYGEQYGSAFRQVFQDLARENDVTFVPFLLEGVAGIAPLNQADGIHPTRAGAARIADHLWPAVTQLMASDRDR